MSRKRYYGIGVASILLLTGCSDKNDPVTLPDLSTEKTYSGTSLELYYNNEQMPGKSAVLKKDGDKANITFSCAFDLSQLTGMGLSGSLPGPGVTPGTPVLSIVTPLAITDDGYTLSGSGETEFVTYSYSGTLADDKMIFRFNDCKLKNTLLSGKVFSPSPVIRNGILDYTSLPFHLEWEIDPEGGIDIPLSDILKVAVTAPIIPVYNNTAYTSISEALVNLVKTVALTESGNIPVIYVSTLGGAAHLATSSGTMMQYIPSAIGIKLYLNPLSVVGEVLLATSDNKYDEKFDFEAMLKKSPSANTREASEAGDSVEIDPELKKALIEVILKAFAPSLANGIPLTVEPTAEGADIYLDTATSVGFLGSVLQDAMQNPVIMGALKKALAEAQIPELDPEMIEGLIQQLPSFLIQTTKLEIGLSFIEAK